MLLEMLVRWMEEEEFTVTGSVLLAMKDKPDVVRSEIISLRTGKGCLLARAGNFSL